MKYSGDFFGHRHFPPIGLLVLFLLGAFQYLSPMASADEVDQLLAGEWLRVPDSHLSSVAPPGWDANVIKPWSGGAYDTDLDRLIVWGGGHNDYSGNEIYAFDMKTLRWVRVTDPTENFSRAPAYKNADGTPISRHTYGGLEYIGHAKRFYAHSGAPDSASGGCGVTGTWTFDFDDSGTGGTWYDMQPAGEQPFLDCEEKCVYDPVSKLVYHRSAGWHSYDVDANRWATIVDYGEGSEFSWEKYGRSVVLVPDRRLILEIGQKRGVTQYDLTSHLSRKDRVSSGPTDVELSENPGLAYDQVSGKVVAWIGGSDVYSLDLDTLAWTKHAAANAVQVPAVTADGGVYGRFRYVPSRKVFIVVNSINEDVYIYRFVEGGPAAPQSLRIVKSCQN